MPVGTDRRMSGPGICAAPMACTDGARYDGALEVTVGSEERPQRGAKPSDETPPPFAPMMERTQRRIGRMLRKLEREAGGPLEQATLEAALAAHLTAQAAGGEPDDESAWNDVDRAQELMYRAMESDSLDESARLSKEALALDPLNVDALLFRAEHGATDPADRLLRLRLAVEAGEAALGPEFFESNCGHFYGLVETRPYMRARMLLARALAEAHLPKEARAHFEALLELNPNDNQANRHPLLGLLLQAGDLAAARTLSDRFDEDFAAMEWGRVLLAWLEGDASRAEAALAFARDRNPHVQALLLHDDEPPPDLPGHHQVGDLTEAWYAATEIGPAWDSHPAALSWLGTQVTARQRDLAEAWIEAQVHGEGTPIPAWVTPFFERAQRERPGPGLREPGPCDPAWLRRILLDPALRQVDSAGGGWAPQRAAGLLSAFPGPEVARDLVELLVEVELEGVFPSPLADQARDTLMEMGTDVVDPCLAALEGGHASPDHASGLYYALSHAGVSDERVFERLIEGLAREPIELPYLLAVYGDRRALPLLQARLAQVRAEGDDEGMDEYLVGDVCEAITMLGGTPERAAAFGRGTLSGRLDAWMNPEPEDREGGPDAAAPKPPGRNEPCWCGSGRKYKRCHLGEDEARGGA